MVQIIVAVHKIMTKKKEKIINELLQSATQYDEKKWFECIIHDLIKSIFPTIIREVSTAWITRNWQIDKVCEATCIWYGV